MVSGGDEVECDLQSGVIVNRSANTSAHFRPLAPEVIEVLEAGGLDQLTVRRLGLGASN